MDKNEFLFWLLASPAIAVFLAWLAEHVRVKALREWSAALYVKLAARPR